MMGGGGGGHTKLQDRNYHHQKAVEQAEKRKAVAMYESEEDEYFDGPAFLFRARSETRDQENSEEENEDRYDERRENYHTRRIQHEEEPPFAYKDVAERLALECFRRKKRIYSRGFIETANFLRRPPGRATESERR